MIGKMISNTKRLDGEKSDFVAEIGGLIPRKLTKYQFDVQGSSSRERQRRKG